MSEELKPCPFCGGGVHWDGRWITHNVPIDDCVISTEQYADADAWNRRADHFVDAGKAPPKPETGNIGLQALVQMAIYENIDAKKEDGGILITGLDRASRAVIALFAEREKAAGA